MYIVFFIISSLLFFVFSVQDGLYLLYISFMMLVVSQLYKVFRVSLGTPSFILFVISSFFYLGGIVIYIFRDYYYYNLPGELSYAANGYMTFFVFFYIFYFVSVSVFGGRRVVFSDKEYQLFFDYEKMRLVYYFLIILNYGSVHFIYGGINNAPIFSYDIEMARMGRNFNDTGYLWFVFFSTYHTVFFGFVLLYKRYCSRGKLPVYDMAMLFVAFFPLILYGGRSHIMIPLIMIFLYLYRVAGVSKKQILAFVFLGILCVQIYGAFRFTGGYIDSFTYLHYFFSDTFPEIRTIIYIDHVMGDSSIRPFEFLFNFLFIMMPRAFLDFFGINKQYFLDNTLGAYFVSFDPYSSTRGYRLTLLGEITVLSTQVQIILTAFMMAIIFYFIDNRYDISGKSMTNNDVLNYKYSFITALFIAVVPYGFTFLGTTIWLLVQMYILFKIITYKKECSKLF